MACLGRGAEVAQLMCLARAQLAEVDEVLVAGRLEISSSLVAPNQNQLSYSDAPLARIYSSGEALWCWEVWVPSTTTENNPLIKVNTLVPQNKINKILQKHHRRSPLHANFS